MSETPEAEPLFVRVAECLYRNRSSGTYFALVKRNGKQRRQSLKTQDRKLAERRLREFRESADRLTASGEERKKLFESLAARWLDVHGSTLKASSADRNRRCVKELNKVFGRMPISEITKRDCEDWMIHRISGLAASTFNKEAEVLKAVLAYAQRDGLLLDNPAKVIKRIKSSDREIVIPTREQFRRLLEALLELDQRAEEAVKLVQLLALSGMRLGEATRIRWQEVDYQNARFTVTGGDAGTKMVKLDQYHFSQVLSAFLKVLKPQPRGSFR